MPRDSRIEHLRRSSSTSSLKQDEGKKQEKNRSPVFCRDEPDRMPRFLNYLATLLIHFDYLERLTVHELSEKPHDDMGESEDYHPYSSFVSFFLRLEVWIWNSRNSPYSRRGAALHKYTNHHGACESQTFIHMKAHNVWRSPEPHLVIPGRTSGCFDG